jgi:signal transduction histidine kinase/ActR/RegA family two-component response regulator
MVIGKARLPLVFGVLAAVFALVIVGLAQLQNNRVLWIRHTLEVENAISDLGSAVNQVEALQRGYMLTGQDVYLRPFTRNMNVVAAQAAHIQALTADNPTERAAVARLQPAVQRKQAELETAVNLRRIGDPRADDSLKDGSTRSLTAQVILILRGMRQTEEGLLAARTHQVDMINTALLVAIAVTGLGVLVFSALWVRQAHKTGRALESAYAELSATHAELMSATASRAAAENQVRQMQKMEAVGQLTGGIAHDFNNMLAVVIGNLNMIQRRLAKGRTDVGNFAASAMEGANRAATLTSRLLAFSRQQPLAPEPIDPNRLVLGMSDLLARTLGEAVVVETVLGAGLWRTQCDATQLESALVNLAVNARDSMPGGGRLTIETVNTHLDADYADDAGAKPGQYVMIAVTDTGAGMTADVVEKAVDPFFTTKPVGKGTGLGLSQVYGFVKQSGGHFRIYSEPGEGTTVKIYLPRLFGPQAENAPPAVRAKAAPHNELKHTVLLVEDDERVRQFAHEALLDLGYRVVEADSAARAMGHLQTDVHFDLLLTDIVMPETNGRQLAEQALRLKPGLPVLYMTGFTRNAVVHNGMLDPGVNFLPKPFTIDQLASKVRESIEGAMV